MSFRTRFAPSPTGPLHLGHAYSAILAHDMAMAEGGEFLLRIEDIDSTRSRPEWEDGIFDDLRWLGLSWEEPVMRQSERLPAYRDALQTLWHEKALLYPCTCTRRDMEAALTAPQEGGTHGPDGLIYPGTCREKTSRLGKMPKNTALRLDMSSALGRRDPTASPKQAPHMPAKSISRHATCSKKLATLSCRGKTFSDPTICRLSSTTRNRRSPMSSVAKTCSTPRKSTLLLQDVLGLPTPTYHHHKLIRDDAGKRLAKRDDSRAIGKYREDGANPNDIRKMVGL